MEVAIFSPIYDSNQDPVLFTADGSRNFPDEANIKDLSDRSWRNGSRCMSRTGAQIKNGCIRRGVLRKDQSEAVCAR
jgi:hypothetical protein